LDKKHEELQKLRAEAVRAQTIKQKELERSQQLQDSLSKEHEQLEEEKLELMRKLQNK